MVEPKLLIIGDSFSSDDTKDSWVNHLHYRVTNLSSGGSSEYRILKKLENINVNLFDKILIVHTSPNRIYIDKNPIHIHDSKYQECDLIYNDVKDKHDNKFARLASWYFEECWDIEHATYIHNLLIKQAMELTKHKGLHITFFDYHHPMLINFYDYWKKFPGDINHLNIEGNLTVSDYINSLLIKI